MSDQTLPVNLLLERMNRLSRSVSDVMEGQNGHVRRLLAMMQRLDERLGALESRFGAVETRLAGVEREMASLAAEQALLGTRVGEAFSRALRVDIRLDDQEDRARADGP